MDYIFKKQKPALAMHKQSHTMTKSKPKVRIIHIFAPEIIKTDVANFRELVQRLTGKPDDDHHQKGCRKNPIKTSGDLETEQRSLKNAKKMEMIRSGFLNVREQEEEEEELLWNNGESSDGFLNGLLDLDGFIQELGEFPYLPLDASNMHGAFAESHQLA